MNDVARSPAGGAVAIWVKTPGLSPVKTRLAAKIGAPDAERFHLLAAAAAGAAARAAAEIDPTLTPYWAVAEHASDSWVGLASVWQGDGGLGQRLSRVYDELLARHRFVIFLGADSPQINPALIVDAAQEAKRGSFVLGPAEDGGFYLFAGSRPLPAEVWTAVPYSESNTLRSLEAGLTAHGTIRRGATLFDVDEPDDLNRLGQALQMITSLLPEQETLRLWLASRAGERGGNHESTPA